LANDTAPFVATIDASPICSLRDDIRQKASSENIILRFEQTPATIATTLVTIQQVSSLTILPIQERNIEHHWKPRTFCLQYPTKENQVFLHKKYKKNIETITNSEPSCQNTIQKYTNLVQSCYVKFEEPKERRERDERRPAIDRATAAIVDRRLAPTPPTANAHVFSPLHSI
jgi:hypothetical protein